MQRFDLARVDDGLAVEAQLLDEGRFRDEALFVVDVGIDGVQSVDAGGSGRVEDHAAGEQQFDAVASGGLQVGDVVFRAERDTDQTVGRVGDLTGVQHAVGALDGSHHQGGAYGNAGFALDAGDLLFAVDDVLRGVGLRQSDDVDACSYDGFQVFDAEAGVQVVDSDDQFLLTVLQVVQRLVDEESRRVLLHDGDGVLQVEHDGVGAVDVAVADHAGVVAGHEHHGSSEAFLFSHFISPPIHTHRCRQRGTLRS